MVDAGGPARHVGRQGWQREREEHPRPSETWIFTLARKSRRERLTALDLAVFLAVSDRASPRVGAARRLPALSFQSVSA